MQEIFGINTTQLRLVAMAGYNGRCFYSACRDLHTGSSAEGWAERSALVYGGFGLVGSLSGFVALYGRVVGWSTKQLRVLQQFGNGCGLLGWGTALPGGVAICQRDRTAKNGARVWLATCLAGHYVLALAGVPIRRTAPLIVIGLVPAFSVWAKRQLTF